MKELKGVPKIIMNKLLEHSSILNDIEREYNNFVKVLQSCTTYEKNYYQEKREDVVDPIRDFLTDLVNENKKYIQLFYEACIKDNIDATDIWQYIVDNNSIIKIDKEIYLLYINENEENIK